MPPDDRSPLLRRAGPADADAIRDLVHAAYVGYTPLIGRTPLPMLADYDAAVRAHEVWLLVDDAVGGDPARVVGVIELDLRDDHLWIENVAIDPAAQGRGYGRRLLRHAESTAAAHGRDELRLLTNERYSANIAMYERYGYVETHREPYQGTDLVYFRKPLNDPEAPR